MLVLFMMSKIQILKAIHNPKLLDINLSKAVYDVKDTNFESNSQQIVGVAVAWLGCL